MKRSRVAAIALLLAGAACATPGIEGTGEQRAIASRAAQQAAQQHPKVVEEFGGAVTAAREAYVDAVGARVAAQTGVQAGGFRFTTLNSPVMNAFAVPGGYVYITRQLLALMNNEAELGFVLGHEVGHITADHGAQRQNRGLLSQLGAVLVGIFTGSGALAQLAGQVSQGLFLQYSRSQELEADDLGVRYMNGAGYDPLRSTHMLARLGAWSGMEARFSGRDDDARATPSWARTHPLSSERVTRATAEAQATGRAGQGTINAEQHLAVLNGMVFDDDPAQGVVEGRDFLHPDLRLAFTVPPGFGIQNGSRAVAVIGSSGQAQFSTGAYGGDLGAYIAQVFRGLTGGQGQVAATPPRAVSVNGIPAAYSTAQVQTNSGLIDVAVFAYEFASNRAYHFVTVTQGGQGLGPFASMVQSLRRLSAAQAAAIRPRVIQIVTVGANDTMQSLASRMAYGSYQLDRFRLLNGLDSGAALQRGQRVKLIVYGNR